MDSQDELASEEAADPQRPLCGARIWENGSEFVRHW